MTAYWDEVHRTTAAQLQGVREAAEAAARQRSWESALLGLANADDADPAAEACRPPEVVDGGPWAGLTLRDWVGLFGADVTPTRPSLSPRRIF